MGSQKHVCGQDLKRLFDSGGGKDACQSDRCCSDLLKEENSSLRSELHKYEDNCGEALPTYDAMKWFVHIVSLTCLLVWCLSRGCVHLGAYLLRRVINSFWSTQKDLENTWRGNQVQFQCFRSRQQPAKPACKASRCNHDHDVVPNR